MFPIACTSETPEIRKRQEGGCATLLLSYFRKNEAGVRDDEDLGGQKLACDYAFFDRV